MVKSRVNVGDIFKPDGLKMFSRKLLELKGISKSLPTAWVLNEVRGFSITMRAY